MRVSTNTVFGLGGVFDVASEFGTDRQGEDFGQTLGFWGMPSGPYVVWPLLGPSTVRESLALPLDRSVSPALAVQDTGAKYAIVVLQTVSERASLLGASGLLDDIALDKYTFVRDAYLQRRRSLIYDGNVPEPKDADKNQRLGNAPSSAPKAADPPASQPAL